MNNRPSYPVELSLPDGKARLHRTVVDGDYFDLDENGRLTYELNGQLLTLDLTIPKDLQGRWFWWGSFLSMVVPPGEPGLSIATTTFPPPGMPNDRGTCFDAARRIEAERVTRLTALAAEAARKASKRPKRAKADLVKVAPVIEPEPARTTEQMSFLEAA